jgi:hypothetical protein
MPKDKDKLFFTGPLTRKQFRKERRAATRSRYRPALKAKRQEIRQSRLQQARIGDYFQGYQSDIAKSGAAQQAAYDKAQQSIAQATGGAQDAALRAELNAEEAMDAERRGTTRTPSTVGAAAALARQRLASSAASTLATQGARIAASGAERQRITSRESVEQQLKEASRRRLLKSELSDVKKEKGEYKAGYMAEARESERAFALAMKELTSTRKIRAQGRETRRGQRLAAELDPPDDDGKNGGRTPSQIRADKKEREEARWLVKTLYATSTTGLSDLREQIKEAKEAGDDDALVQKLQNKLEKAGRPPKTTQEWREFAQGIAQENPGVSFQATWAAVQRLRPKTKAPGVGEGLW